MKSIFRDNYNKVQYRMLNEKFPCIEGHLFQPLTNVFLAHQLTHKAIINNDTSYRTKDYIRTHYTFTINKTLQLRLHLSLKDKRINFTIYGPWREEIEETMQEKHSLFRPTPTNEHTHFQYSLKYNFKNCKKFCEVLRDLPDNFNKRIL